MNFFKSLLTIFFVHSQCFGGNLNVVHLGPRKEIKLEVKAGGATQEFSLGFQNATGIFTLPKEAAALRILDNDIPSLKIAAQDTGQIAVFHPSGESFKWSIYDSKPTEGKTTLRLINLMEEEVVVLQGENKITLKGKSVIPVEKVTKAPIRLGFENGEKPTPHEQEEPSAVLGFVYKSDTAWKIFYINDT
jgi:hypothetical protein